MLKILLVYVHLLAACIALGGVLGADHKLWSWRKEALGQAQHEYLEETRKIATLALLALWVTGLLLVLQGYLLEGAAYLLNQKLWAKVAVVVLLNSEWRVCCIVSASHCCSKSPLRLITCFRPQSSCTLGGVLHEWLAIRRFPGGGSSLESCHAMLACDGGFHGIRVAGLCPGACGRQHGGHDTR